MKLKTKIDNLIRKISDRVTGNGLMQEEVKAEEGNYVTPGISDAIRQAAAEGMVLLKNDGVLPFENSRKIAVFGRCQFDWFYVGYGSGGNVNAPYKVNLDEALVRAQQEGYIKLNEKIRDFYLSWRKSSEAEISDGWWGHWPMCYPEAVLQRNLIAEAAKQSDVAVMVIGRAAGEDRENKLDEGSYYLTKQENAMLDLLTAVFEKTVVVINSGNIIDMSWQEKYKDRISAILFAWQGGMESGNAVADVLTGKTNPSGKLCDTIARKYEDYPSSSNFGAKDFNNYVEDIYVGYRYFETFAKNAVLYPFGHGLSYTSFSCETTKFTYDGNNVIVTVKVTNTGNRAGKEAVGLYVSAPQGRLGKAARSLVCFAKTKELQAGESEELTLCADRYAISSYDDRNDSNTAFSYLLEAGEYSFYAGSNVREAVFAGKFVLEKDDVLQKLSPVCRVQNVFDRIKPVIKGDGYAVSYEKVPVAQYSLKDRILSNLTKGKEEKKVTPFGFDKVVSGEKSLDEFVETLNDEELQALTRGYGCMNAPQGVRGNAGSYAGIIPSLQQKGVRAVITTDGPAGIRIGMHTSLLPCGSALACSWNTDIVEKLYSLVADEMAHYDTDVLLGAGMNIHRNPLCGRNFEYFSEDPLISGKFAAAFVNGIQKKGKVACPKHFACNNQEVKRNTNDSRVSERALREIYLKGFEICVKESAPLNIMTSYNKINGVWSHYNYDLATTVLRGEWGFDGTVITDWWMRKSASPEFASLKDNAYRVRAQVDVLMPGDMRYVAKGYKKDKNLLKSMRSKNGITKEEMRLCAKNTLKTLLWLEKNKH